MFRIEVSKKNSRGKQLQLLSEYGRHASRHVTYTLNRLTGRGGGKRVVGRIDEDDLGKVTGPKTPVDWSGVECCSSAVVTQHSRPRDTECIQLVEDAFVSLFSVEYKKARDKVELL